MTSKFDVSRLNAILTRIFQEDPRSGRFEDPAWGLKGNAAVRKQVRIPIATNMYPARFDDLGPAIRMEAVDVVLTDLHYWEGPRGVKDLCAVCQTFNLGVAMHSGAEFGIELAAMLHTASTIPRRQLFALLNGIGIN